MIQVQIKDTAGSVLRELAEQFPREFRAGMSTLGVTLRSRIRKELEAGNVAGQTWPALHPLTLAIRRAQGLVRGRKFGGKLPGLIRYQLNESKNVLRVGWLEEMTPGVNRTAAPFQEYASRPVTRGGHKLRRLLKVQQEKVSIRPARPVMTPLAESAATGDEVVRIVAGRIRNVLETASRRRAT